LPLHPGRGPARRVAWRPDQANAGRTVRVRGPSFFTRTTRLAREIATHIVADRGPEEILRRLSDPFWLQAFGCVLGFDWHFSGVTTTVTGALKEGMASNLTSAFTPGGYKGPRSRKPLSKSVNGATGWLLIPGR
jgi:hypothetical protein